MKTTSLPSFGARFHFGAFALGLLLATIPTARADTAVVINEIMYHPATNEPAMEWVELYNQLAVDVDISDWSIAGGISYTFPSNTIVRGGGFVVVSVSPSTLNAVLGKTNVLGPFLGRLSNSGDLLRLRNNSGRVVDEVTYGADGDWPVAPDGSGVTVAKFDRDGASGSDANWRASDQIGGTPGADNFPYVNALPIETRQIAIDGAWKFEASGTDLGTAWRGLAFDDNSWGFRTSLVARAVTTLFNTGVDANRAALAAGASDPHYILTAAAQGTVGANAMVELNNAAWLANDATSTWIGVVNSGATGVAQGNYNFRTSFTLDGFIPSTVQVNLVVAADNSVANVLLNGVAKGISYVGFAAWSGTNTLQGGFVSGTNTIEFQTINDPTTPNPGGFRAALNGTGLAANTNAPLPAGRVTYYFRKNFTFAGNAATASLRMDSVVADGAVYYLNGVEVLRRNMPGGTVSYATPASSIVTAPAYGGMVSLPTDALVQGNNVLAVEVHMASGNPNAALLGVELYSSSTPVPPVPLAFNEVAAATNSDFWIELSNNGTNVLMLDGWRIYRDGTTNSEFAFPGGTSIPARGFLAVSNAALGFKPIAGDKLYLTTPSGGNVFDGVVVKNRHRGRSPDATGSWLWPDQPTPGGPNHFAFRTELVINEIMYNPHPLPATNGLPPRSSPEAWIEIFNRSASPVDLTGWELAGGVQYTFTPGKTLAPGAYLVIADDVPFLKSLYPSIDIVGDFGGRLSGRSDHIILKDPTGNPADDVRYFDGGRWPAYADGGGSSLELRDPNSDNSKAEAWAASDEMSKTAWQTFTYRMVANIPSGSGQPTTWQDFILGLQSEGECLIDDLSVIELPASAPAQIIANGNFENGLTGWRMLGTHGHSLVESEPGNPGNKVLHLVATGPQEHMHNHIETTLTAGKSITAGREYEVSFRARWLAGNNLLNTRLYFNRVGRTTALPMPALNGTPGAQNSRLVANIGPTFSAFSHARIVPAAGEPVTVSVTAEDPQGIASAQLFWSVNSGAWNNAAMTNLGGGRYQGTIPGQGAGAVVQFYVRATDGLGAAATYPARGADSGALYKVEDSQAILSLAHNVRIILTPANIDLMHGTAQGASQTNVMSNDLLPCTVVYDESRVYYDCAVHLRGSQRGRYSDVRTGFHIEFPPDDLFRGVHPVMLIDRSGAGDATANRQEEIVLKHILNRAGGIPGSYSEICRLIAPRSVHTGPAQFFPRHEDVFIETAFENGSDGRMFEMELIYYPTTANAAGYKLPQPDSVVGTDITDLGNDKEVYRYNFMIKNHREADDYTSFIALVKAWSLPANNPALDAQTRQLMDLNQWMRAYALVSLCSVGDMYTFGNNHNFFTYQRPSDGRFVYFPWDMDFAFSRGASGALVGDQNLGKIVNLPGNLRLMYAHMLDIIGVSFNTAYMTYWTDHYDNFAPGQSYAGSLSTIGARVPFVQSQIAAGGGNSPFAVTGTNVITTSNNLITLAGTAPVQVQRITINGRDYPVTWSSISAWTLRVPVSNPTNTLLVEAFDLAGRPLTNLTRAITVNYTGTPPDPAGTVVINEIMYNPGVPDASFVELFNASTNFAFDLSNWEINGLGYAFPVGSVLTNRGYLLLAGNLSSFASAYGTNAPVPVDAYAGTLQNDGETLTLLRPGAAPGETVVVDRVRYESAPPWSASANGTGPSLQLLDATQDNSRVANWSDGAGWRYFSTNGIPGTSQSKRLMLWLDAAGRVNIDDVFLALGPVAEVGSNYINNGGFELPLTGYWKTNGHYAGNTTISTAVKHGGNSSMELVFTNAGGSSQYFYYDLTNAVTTSFDTTVTYTLSFWYLPTTNANRLTARLGSPITPNFSVRPVFSTPGTANSVAQTVPAFPPLWLNEVQAENINGITDNTGTREPWLEIVNTGTNTISLDGFFLSDSYTNLARWSFPAGASIAPGEFKVIFADGESAQTTPTEWHASFRPAPGAGSVALSRTVGNAPQIVDYLNYTNLPAGRSYGDFPDAQPFFREEFFVATPGAPNTNTAPPLVAYINEWMAANTHTLLNTNNGNRYDDWFELYNPGNSPASLDGYFLTDNLSNKTQFAIPSGFRIPAHGYLLVWADNAPGLNNTNIAELHVNFALRQNGEQIGLFAPDGTLIDGVTFEPQFNDLSQGRYADGIGQVYFLATPTPRGPNSSWANRYPVMPFIADAAITAGQTLGFYANASDPDAPTQTLTYWLDAGAPTGAVVNASSGLFSWTPSPAQMPSTNVITLRVADNGTPTLGAARTFQVIVRQELRVSGIAPAGGNNLGITFGTIPGKLYRVDYKNALEDPAWLPLTAETPAAGTSMSVTVSMAGQGQRFYRIVQVN